MKIATIAISMLLATVQVHGESTAVTISTQIQDARVISAMKQAWIQTQSCTNGTEAGFRLDEADGNLIVISQPFTNQHMKEKMQILPGVTTAIFHVHPSDADPRPSIGDMKVADRYGVRIYTMHRSGLYVYDPATGKTTRLQERLTWLKD
jgi:hypothetical protein